MVTLVEITGERDEPFPNSLCHRRRGNTTMPQVIEYEAPQQVGWIQSVFAVTKIKLITCSNFKLPQNCNVKFLKFITI